MSEREDVEALALALGEMNESYNLTWMNDEQSTEITIDVEVLAERILASSWLAARDEAVRVSERVRLARRLERWAWHYRDDRRGVYYEHAARIVGEPERLIEPSVPGVRLTEEE